MQELELKKANYDRVIQLELNEISKEIIEKLVDAGELPNFAHVLHNWRKFVTTSEAEYEKIEPWIQWVSAHTGASFAEHGIFRLSDAEHLKTKQIWETLSDKNIESCIVGCMNALRGKTKGGIFFPDPWSQRGRPFPDTLKPLYDLISAKVQGHATRGIALSEYLKGALILLNMKLSPKIYFRIARDIMITSFSRKSKWRLAGTFDLLLSEIFSVLLRDRKYKYCSLFLNSVAHYQHHFWRAFEPSKFSAQISCPDCRDKDNPVLYGYKIYDRILGDLIAHQQNDSTLIIVASGLSQTPFLEKEYEGGMNYYRLKDHRAFAQLVHLPVEAFPLMSRDWQLGRFSEEQLPMWLERMNAIRIGSEPLFNVKINKDGFLFLETAITRLVSEKEVILSWDGSELGSFDAFFSRIAVKSGHHLGEGVLFVSEKTNSTEFQKIPLTDLFKINLQPFSLSAGTPSP